MKINPDDFRVPPGKKVDLKKWPTEVKPGESKGSVRYMLVLAAMEGASDR